MAQQVHVEKVFAEAIEIVHRRSVPLSWIGLARTIRAFGKRSRSWSWITSGRASSWSIRSPRFRTHPRINLTWNVPARRSARTSCCKIGEGGMGIVFMAEQTEPVQRKVALKVIKPGMDSRQVIARFEAERQALAMMDHVNIARVLDAGTTAAGPARTSSWNWSTACRSPSTATTTT